MPVIDRISPSFAIGRCIRSQSAGRQKDVHGLLKERLVNGDHRLPHRCLAASTVEILTRPLKVRRQTSDLRSRCEPDELLSLSAPLLL